MQSSRFIKLPVNELQMGMFIAELDKPWLDSPFLIQGFCLENRGQIEVLSQECRYVTVDTGKSVRVEDEKKLTLEKSSKPKAKSLGKNLQQTFSSVKLTKYADSSDFDGELTTAKSVYADYEQSVARIYEDFNATKSIDLKTAQQAVGGIVESMIRNPDACLLLQQIRRKGDYLYNHAIGTSIWSAALARQIGLPKQKVKMVALAGLLCDVGKVSVSTRILHKATSLSAEEYQHIQGHVHIDAYNDENFRSLSSEVKEIIRSHHERHDGSGYPEGLSGDDIPVFARIVGVADSYDAMTTNRSYAKALAPYEATRELYALRNIKFQAEIIEEFIQTLGLYPVGTLVELSDGRVGVVISEYRVSRLRPKLLIVLDESKTPIEDHYYINLSHEDYAGIDIARGLESGAYDLDPDDFFI